MMGDGFDPAGVAVFIAVVCAVVAFALTGPAQWGLRRIAVGASVAAAAIAALTLAYSPWWWTGIPWGIYQVFLGWSFIVRRTRVATERFEYLHSSARVLSYIALADGEITPREIQIIQATYARAGFSEVELREVEQTARDCERHFLNDGSDPDRLFALLKDACSFVSTHSNEQTRLIFLRTAILIAASDGYISRAETRALRAGAMWLGLSTAEVDKAWDDLYSSDTNRQPGHDEAGEGGPEPREEEPQVPPDLATYYAALLGVAVTATPSEIKRAYREKAKMYHPDVVAHRGPEFARLAEEKFKEISRAYDYFRGVRVAS